VYCYYHTASYVFLDHIYCSQFTASKDSCPLTLQESLCIQFWDKESFIDGPIRCLLCNLEGVFPFRTAEFVRLLSALCEGSWPAECV
jgi:hypothetical protein